MYFMKSPLNLNVLEPKLITFATSIEPDQPAHLCSLTRPYTVGWLTLNSNVGNPKINNGLF